MVTIKIIFFILLFGCIYGNVNAQDVSIGSLKAKRGITARSFQNDTTVYTISDSVIYADSGNVYVKTLSSNVTMSFDVFPKNKCITVLITNTASNYTVSWTGVNWVGITPPTQTIGSKSDLYTFIKIRDRIIGNVAQNINP